MSALEKLAEADQRRREADAAQTAEIGRLAAGIRKRHDRKRNQGRGTAPLTQRQQTAHERLREAVSRHSACHELSLLDGCGSPALQAAKQELLEALREVRDANAPEAPETAQLPTESETQLS